MGTKKPFIPLDKPKSWVIFICASLLSIAFGLLGFVIAMFGLKLIAIFPIALFAVCWFIGAISWLVFIFGLISGRYINLKPKPWSEQIW